MLVQKISPIERIALQGTEARLGDESAKLALIGGVLAAGGTHNVLLDQDAAHVIAAEAEGDLADLVAGGQP